MTEEEARRLYDAAQDMAEAMGIDFPSEVVVPFMDHPGLEAVEHACHELAHAVLLKIPIFADDDLSLSDRIAAAINKLSQYDAARNEALCFVVEREVLAELGIEFDAGDLLNALEIQVHNHEEVLDIFSSGEVHEEAREAVRRIPLIFRTYTERVR